MEDKGEGQTRAPEATTPEAEEFLFPTLSGDPLTRHNLSASHTISPHFLCPFSRSNQPPYTGEDGEYKRIVNEGAGSHVRVVDGNPYESEV